MDFDPRDRDHDERNVEMPWVDVRDAVHDVEDPRTQEDDLRERDWRERDGDPRDPFIDSLELPRGPERELELDGHRRYELNGDDSRTLATTGTFRVIASSYRPPAIQPLCRIWPM